MSHGCGIRVLEASIANEYFSGVDDLTMPQSQFCALSLPVQKVFVVENKINFLTFPKLAGSLLIWGAWIHHWHPQVCSVHAARFTILLGRH